MIAKLEQSWCPTCREWTVIDAGRPCAWCDTRTIKKRGGWKREDLHANSKISRAQAHAIRAAHERGKSLRELADAVWQTLGYASPKSCLEGIRYALKREGLKTRTRREGVRLHNQQRSTRLPGEDTNAFKRRRRREIGYIDGRTGQRRIAT